MDKDLLGTVKAALALVYEPQKMGSGVSTEDASVWRRDADGIDRVKHVSWNDIRALVDRCEQAEAELARMMAAHPEESCYDAMPNLRQRHAEAVEAMQSIHREAGSHTVALYGTPTGFRKIFDIAAAWLASEAKARLT